MTDWDDYRFALAILREGGLSAAARRLGATHATVARRLDRLEARLGRRLFERTGGGLTPTAEGRALAGRAAAMEEAAAAAARDIAAAEPLAGPLSLTLPPVFLITPLAADLAAFRAAHPAVALSLTAETRLANLHLREADVALRVTRRPAESLWGRRAAEQRAGWFGAPGLGAGSPKIVLTHWAVKIAAEAPGPVAAETDDIGAALSLAAAGLGIVRAPMALGAAARGLRLIPELPAADMAPVWLLTHPDLRRASRVRTLMAFLARRFQARRGDFLGPRLETGRDAARE